LSFGSNGSHRHKPTPLNLDRHSAISLRTREVKALLVEAVNGLRVSPAVINFWLDTLLMLAFVALSITAVIVQFVFPPGVTAKGWLLWGMDFGQWCSIQFAILAVLGFGVVVHVMLHWQWVCGVVVRKLLHRRELPDDGIRTIYGVGLLIALLLTGATIIGIAMLTIQMSPQ
jgi:hypothetical protein